MSNWPVKEQYRNHEQVYAACNCYDFSLAPVQGTQADRKSVSHCLEIWRMKNYFAMPGLFFLKHSVPRTLWSCRAAVSAIQHSTYRTHRTIEFLLILVSVYSHDYFISMENFLLTLAVFETELCTLENTLSSWLLIKWIHTVLIHRQFFIWRSRGINNENTSIALMKLSAADVED